MAKNSLFPIPAEPLKYDTYADFPSILPDGTLVLDLSTDKLYTYDLSTNTYLPVSSGGQVNTIVAGIGISVDDTDPVNPIVSNTIPIVTPAGSNTELQFNNGGSFGADAQLTFDYTNKFFKTYFTDGATFNIETTNNALGFGVKASVLTETDGTNTSLIGTFDNTHFGGAVVNSGIINMNLSTMGITSFIVNDGSIRCSTPSSNFTVVNDTDGIVLSSSDGLPKPIQFYLSGNMVAKFEPTGKLSLLNRGIYNDATLNFSSDGSDPSVYVEGDVWRNGDRLFFVKSTGAFDIANQITIPAGSDTEVQFNKLGVFSSSSNFVFDYTNNYLGLRGTPICPLDVYGKNFPVYRAEREVTSTNTFNSTSVLVTKSTGNASDGFGGGLVFAIKDTGLANDSVIASIGAVRDGADTSGRLEFNVYKSGTLNEGAMFIDKNGLVSIGEATTVAPLNISLAGGVAQNTMLKLRTRSTTTGRTADIDFAITTSTTAILARYGAIRTDRATSGDTSFAWSLYSGGTLTERMRLRDDGLLMLPTDNTGIILGAGNNASVYYNGTNMIINPKVVGSGIVDVSGTLQTDGYNSSDGSTGITTTKSWVDNGGNTHDVTVKDGLITAWTAT